MKKGILFAIFFSMLVFFSSVSSINVLKVKENNNELIITDPTNYLDEEIDDIGWYASLNLDSNDRSHISYYDYSNGDLKYAVLTGNSWNIESVDTEGNVGRYTSITLDTENNPHISYYDYSNGDLKYAKKTTDTWATETIDSWGKVGLYTSIVLDTQNNAHISYCDYDNRNLKYAKWTGSSWDKTVVDRTGTIGVFEYFGDYTSIALDSNDDPHISYCDFGNYDLKYAHWDSNSWFSEIVDEDGELGQYSSLVIDDNDNPHISYGYLTKDSDLEFDLKYAVKTNGNWDIKTVDSSGDIRKWISLKLNSDNYPHITYYDYTEGSLKYSYYNGDSWIFDTIESEGSTGCFNSLCLDNDNNPYIAYYDWGRKALKYTVSTDNIWDVQIVQVDTNTDFLDQEQKYCCGYAYLIEENKPLAQAFQPTYKVLCRVELMIVKRYNPGSITISIREELDGDDLALVTLTADEVAEDMAWKEFNFPDIEVTPGNTYYIICNAFDIVDYDAYYWYFGINNAYTNGESWIKRITWREFTISDFPEIDFGFKTFGLDTKIPSIPIIDGPTSGKIGETHEYSLISEDEDGDEISYYVDFDDGNSITVGPNPPGSSCTVSHAWSKQGTYTIKAKAFDIHGAESDWGTLSVSMPRLKSVQTPLLLKILELLSKIL
jgi:hypothetical protein